MMQGDTSNWRCGNHAHKGGFFNFQESERCIKIQDEHRTKIETENLD